MYVDFYLSINTGPKKQQPKTSLSWSANISGHFSGGHTRAKPLSTTLAKTSINQLRPENHLIFYLCYAN